MRQISRFIAASLFSVVTLLASLPAYSAAANVKTAAQTIDGLRTDSVSVMRNGSLVTVNMALDLANLDIDRNRAILLTPALVNGTDTVRLNPVGLYGATRWAQQQRIGHPLGGDDALMVRSGSSARRAPFDYSTVINYAPGLEGSQLVLLAESCGCCNHIYDRAATAPLDTLRTPAPEPYDIGEPMWIVPALTDLQKRERQTKTRTLTGSAFIDFPVNQTVIYPDYRGNAAELKKIRETMNVVFTDPDVTVNLISIKGFASPEGSYANNVRLAKGRTEALRDYVRDVYKLSNAVFQTSSEPEDWAGLRAAVDTLDIADKDAILAVIDSDLAPDPKDALLKNRFPKQYQYLLTNIYPALRHSDYRIDYLVRDYDSANDIESVMQRDPTKLSLEEFYIAAAAHEPGSPEFVGIFAMALQYYPDDVTSHYNLAVSALLHGDPDGAEKHVDKLPDDASTRWLREQIQAMRDHNEKLLNK